MAAAAVVSSPSCGSCSPPTADAASQTLPQLARWLNEKCACGFLSRDRLADSLADASAAAAELVAAKPLLFSSTHVFLSDSDAAEMTALVEAVEAVVSQPAWVDFALQGRPRRSKNRGAFMGFDFHIGAEGPRLIEINTNAGGGLLNAFLRDAQEPCCDAAKPWLESGGTGAALVKGWISMFQNEWNLDKRGPDAKLRRVAMADDDPESQFLFPEFHLFQAVMEAVGIPCNVVHAPDFTWDGTQLLYQGEPVDLVYNRTTDFDLSEETHAALREAWEAGAVVVSPNPDHHALYANKRNLGALREADKIPGIVLTEEQNAVLKRVIPPTVIVTPENSTELYNTRKKWFFKPAAGFGSRAAYRGDKMTRRVWDEIQASPDPYVAQEIIPPAERQVRVDQDRTMLKSDIRAYSYAGKVQLFAARLYQGQTTNFRTRGGGFAPVQVVPDVKRAEVEGQIPKEWIADLD